MRYSGPMVEEQRKYATTNTVLPPLQEDKLVRSLKHERENTSSWSRSYCTSSRVWRPSAACPVLAFSGQRSSSRLSPRSWSWSWESGRTLDYLSTPLRPSPGHVKGNPAARPPPHDSRRRVGPRRRRWSSVPFPVLVPTEPRGSCPRPSRRQDRGGDEVVRVLSAGTRGSWSSTIFSFRPPAPSSMPRGGIGVVTATGVGATLEPTGALAAGSVVHGGGQKPLGPEQGESEEWELLKEFLDMFWMISLEGCGAGETTAVCTPRWKG